FCFLLTHRDAFFCSHNLRILIIFVRYKISVSATEGLVQQWLQLIWAIGQMAKWFCIWDDLANPKIGLNLVPKSM
ncbi:hypothetical protein ACFX5D_15955, partial [Flavobacterium sp. LB3P45]